MRWCFGLVLGLFLWAPAVSAKTTPVIGRVDFTVLYDRSMVRSAIGERGFPVEIHGGPSRLSAPDALADVLRLPSGFTNRQLFAVDPANRDAHPVRLVLLFNARTGFYDTACARPSSLNAQTRDGSLDVTAVLCVGPRYMAGGHLSDRAVSGEAHPRFVSVMTQLFKEIMPPENPLRRDGNDR